MSAPPVTHEEDRHRFVIPSDEGDAEALYVRRGKTLVLTHTEVPPAHEGQGWATALAEAAFAYARENGLEVDPACAFMRAYAARHPEWRDIVVARK